MTKLQMTKTQDRRRRRRPRPSAVALAAAAASLAASLHPAHAQNCNPCAALSTGFVQIPGTSCGEFAQCNSNVVSQTFMCQNGLIFDANLNQCNWAHSAVCGPDPECLPDPTPRPTPPPAKPTEGPTTYAPTEDEGFGFGDRPSLGGTGGAASSPSAPAPPSDGGMVWMPAPSSPSAPTPASEPATESSGQAQAQRPAPTAASPNSVMGIEPLRMEHHSAVWAHLNANKIPIFNTLLKSAKRMFNVKGSNIDADELRDYAYYDFYRALRSMSEEGYAVPLSSNEVDAQGNPAVQLARKTFYLGNPASSDAAAVGLINVAVFLSQAMGDSVASGSCDEMNEDLVDGLLPQSNACGQYGMSYQDMECSREEAYMACPVDDNMQLQAEENGRPVTPFYCGPTSTYPYTGEASLISGRQAINEPIQNAKGRAEVEGCCWWGRGTVSTRGVCQYGKLNYYLGARAAAEGRPSRFPDIDFCANPQRICAASRQDGEVEWTSGLFRWVEDVQSYDDGRGWNYIQKLHEFVAGNMADGLFLHHVSSIVAQGCHEAPCPGYVGTAAEMTDGAERWGYFLQVLGALGIPTAAIQ